VSARLFLADESGTYSIMFVAMLPVFLGMGGLAVDGALAFDWRAKLQATADSAALAAAIDLPDVGLARASAHAWAAKGIDPAVHGIVLQDADLEFGNWDQDTREFAPIIGGGLPPDAVRVTLRRTDSNGNAVSTTLLQIIGVSSWDITASAVAQSSGGYRIVD
jgi:Flp pilus assembly protein TadG